MGISTKPDELYRALYLARSWDIPIAVSLKMLKH